MDWMQDGYNPAANSGGGQPQQYGGGQQGGQYQGNQGGQRYNGGGNKWQGGGNKWKGNGGGNNGGGFPTPKPPVENPEPYLAYAVVSNKDIPPEAIQVYERIAKRLNDMGYTVRTGTLEGLESKAEMLPVRKELLLPWKGFNEKESQFTSSTPLIKGIAKKYMKAGNWDELKPAMQGFLQKNARLVTGHYGNSPAKFVICWSQDQAESQNQVTFNTGNIAHALTIAAAWHVPVFNLARPDAEARLFNFLQPFTI